ncbi:MAG: hypothetical protein KGO83_00720 [Paenibacillaceae bacterium]|jgi:hypothetical protein|nr:hypothetical protein [Paenibacillaceae bacterium]
MSYQVDRREDSLNELFVRYADFCRISHNVLEADNLHSFLIWLEKLMLIDQRFLYLLLRKNKEIFHGEREEWLDIAQVYFKQPI